MAYILNLKLSNINDLVIKALDYRLNAKCPVKVLPSISVTKNQ